uniref:protein REVEILLE 2-like n=1 Tax=Erigeron canadensis TaxID=72917 RepID=UPI001CB8D0CF|nr:protein REVEILLE 2-like [Erigeron canadensis]
MVEARKPYTITKQREKWTQEEHEKFLEALKLYGRAWRQIEEHVGNKTAVQLRSHAQKFFSKVVRESGSVDGTEVESIEIPPPRPKRKPTHPYPRKVSLPTKKEAHSSRSTSPGSSGLSHEKGSPKSPESIQSLKLFGQTFFVVDSASPSSPDSSPKLPWNSIATDQEPDSTTHSSDRIETTTQCSSQEGKNDELGSKGDKYAKGFVPYKNWLANKSVHTFMLTDEERKDIRVSLCL